MNINNFWGPIPLMRQIENEAELSMLIYPSINIAKQSNIDK